MYKNRKLHGENRFFSLLLTTIIKKRGGKMITYLATCIYIEV